MTNKNEIWIPIWMQALSASCRACHNCESAAGPFCAVGAACGEQTAAATVQLSGLLAAELG
eukprot:2367218-Amphidinium_carterae.1